MLAAPVLAAWLAATSPHFELMTDAGAKLARELLHDLEQIRGVLAPAAGTPLPVRVVIFRRTEEFARYRPTPIASAFFQSGPDRDYIVATVNANGRFPLPELFHEYVHLVFHHTTPVLPKWLDEGMAEYYSTIEFTANGARVGKPIARHVTTLQRGGWMLPAELAAVKPDSPEYDEEVRAGLFYANAWAAAYVYASQHDGRPMLLPQDYSTEALAGYLDGYRKLQRRSPEFNWSVDQAAPAASEETTALSDSETAVMQADLLLRLGKREYAAEVLNTVKQQTALLERTQALVASERGDSADATRHFERAIAAPDADADSYFEYAVFLNNARAPRQKIAELLAQAITRSPNHAEAQFLQGRLLASAGRHAEALAYFERANAILPREALFAAAIESSREALRRKPPKPIDNVRTPASWMPPVAGNTRINGELVEVECLDSEARIHIAGTRDTRILHITNPKRVLVDASTAAQTELTCGVQVPRPKVEVDFQSASNEVTQLRILPWALTK